MMAGSSDVFMETHHLILSVCNEWQADMFYISIEHSSQSWFSLVAGGNTVLLRKPMFLEEDPRSYYSIVNRKTAIANGIPLSEHIAQQLENIYVVF
jgi:hypothetical protein